jgi:hypothetical protein
VARVSLDPSCRARCEEVFFSVKGYLLRTNIIPHSSSSCVTQCHAVPSLQTPTGTAWHCVTHARLQVRTTTLALFSSFLESKLVRRGAIHAEIEADGKAVEAGSVPRCRLAQRLA